MKIAIFQFSLFGINTYVVWDPQTKDTAVVDPGMINKREEEAMAEFIERNNLKVCAILNTHLHLDHAAGNAWTKHATQAPVMASSQDSYLGKRMDEQAAMFGIERDFKNVTLDRDLKPGDCVAIGNGRLEVLAVPGHSRGSLAFYDREDGFVIVGDALFQGSIGRTDLPGGDQATLIRSITSQLLTLPDSTVVYPGHGEPTTIGAEKSHNPFIR